MEGNHTDVSRFRQGPPPRLEARGGRKPVEKPKARERLSITEWMAQTLEEMKRRVGWVKENPEVTRIRRMTGEYPAIRKKLDTQLTKVERQADEALREATQELSTVIESPLAIEETPQERYIHPIKVDFANREVWQEFKINLTQEFDQAFGKAEQRAGDFEVSLSAPLSSTTLGDLRERGPQPVRVRSESVAGVRMDALMSPPNSNKVSEFRIYGLDGYYRTIPGNQDPVEALIDQARTNQIHYQNWVEAEQQSRETKKMLMGDRWSRIDSQLYGGPVNLEELVKKHQAKLGSQEEYQRSEKILKPRAARLEAEPTVGPLSAETQAETRAEPAVQIEKHKGDWSGTEPRVEPAVDEFVDAMQAKYGIEVAGRLEEHMFKTQAEFDDYFKAWESATHNTSLEPEQQELIKKVFAALKTEAQARGLADKGSLTYLIESYKKIEDDLPQLLEAIDTVKDIMRDQTTARELLPSLQKELNYLNHLRIRTEANPKRTLHQAVEKFLNQYQHLLTLDEIRQIWQADQALDQAEQVDDARRQVAEALDVPGRIVLDKTLSDFIRDYARFMPTQTALFEEKRDALKSYPETINFWDQAAEINDAMNVVKRRAWNKVLAESLGRVIQALKKYGNEMDEEAYPVVSKLKTDLQEGISRGELNLGAVSDIFKKFEPVQFEEYVTQVLWAATGQDMRPAWKKTEEELRLTPPEPPKSETWVREPKATPVEVEWVEEPETGRAEETIVPERFAVSPEAEGAEDEEEEYEDVSAEIPGLLQGLRSVRGTSEEARLAVNRAKEILSSAGSEEMLEITTPMLDRLDKLKSSGQLEDRIYRRALAVLLSADNFEDREQAVADLRAELPVPAQTQENQTQVTKMRSVGGTSDQNQEVA